MGKRTFQQILLKTIRPLEDDLRGQTVVDVPAGKGFTSKHFHDLGSKVVPLDLIPEFFEQKELECQFCDLNQEIPLQDGFADFVISQEGIEHISDQMLAFREFSRVLRPGGKLLLTSPNGSSLKARYSYLMGECEKNGKIMPPNLFDSIWFNSGSTDKIYFGHLFVPTVTKLRVLGHVNGLEVEKIFFSHLKPSNLFLFVLLYPWILISQGMNYLRNAKKRPAVKEEYWKVFKLSVSPKILLDGSLVILFRKKEEPKAAVEDLHQRWAEWQKNCP